MNFIQVIAYRRGAKLLLMLGLFVVLSLSFTAFGLDQVLAEGGQWAPPKDEKTNRVDQTGDWEQGGADIVNLTANSFRVR